MDFEQRLKYHKYLAATKSLPEQYVQVYRYMDNDSYKTVNDTINVECPLHGLFKVRFNNHIVNKHGNAPSKLIQCNNC